MLDTHTLRVQPQRGFLSTSPERHYRGDARGLPPGTRVELSTFTAEVLSATPDGRPAVVDFRFRDPLDSPRLRFVRYEDGHLRPWRVPAPGTVLSLPRQDYLAVLLGEAMRAIRGGP